METQELFRAYNGSDAFLAENARATQMLLVSDLSLFTAFDSSITAAYTTQKQYVFNPSSTSETQEFTGTVAANAIKNIATIAFSSTNLFTFKNTGLAPLVFCLATNSNLEGIQIAIG